MTSHLSSLVLTNSLWIGANQLDAEAGWRWSSGAAFNYVNWNTGEMWVRNGVDAGPDQNWDFLFSDLSPLLLTSTLRTMWFQ